MEGLYNEQTRKIENLWANIHQQTSDKNLTAKYIQQYPIFNELAKQSNQVFMISSLKSMGMLAVSDNFNDILEYGVSLQDVLNWSFLYFSKSIPFEQTKAMVAISFWYSKRKKGILHPQYNQTYCGWKLKTKGTKKIKYLMTNIVGLEYSTKGEPIILMTTISDVSHLLKEDAPFWSTIGLEQGNKFQYLYHADREEIQETSIISPRELEFLKAFEEGLELKDIAEKLSISYKTADSHRHNILQRTGARNSMAALELVKKMGM
ncbi:MAG: response regulator transcription factor [Leadbetterella sp.]